jgi:hypothetical protein
MVTVTLAEWLSAPEVPVKVTMALPAAALAVAVTVTVCAVPGVKLRVAGCAVTPVGNPAIATFTIPVKPLAGAAFTLICCPPPPGTSGALAGAVVRVKSPAAAAGGEPPPQDANRSKQKKLIHAARVFKKALTATPGERPEIYVNLVCVRQLPCTDSTPHPATDCHKLVLNQSNLRRSLRHRLRPSKLLIITVDPP